jgi:hypothetical protein
MHAFPQAPSMTSKKAFPVPVRVTYSCRKCPAYCCTYEEIPVTRRDIERLARHFGIDYATAEARFTKPAGEGEERALRHRKDTVFKTACMNLDQETRSCGVYDARPSICRNFPGGSRCGYYDFLKFERYHQDDPEHVAQT